MIRLRFSNVRTRLTAWNVAVLASILLVYAAGISAVFFLQLRGQLDRHAIEQLETVEGFLHFRPDGTVFLRSDYHDHPYPTTDEARFLEVLAEDGTVLFRNEELGSRALGGAPGPDEGVDSYSPRSMRMPDGKRVRLISRRHAIEGRMTLIRLALSEKDVWRRLLQLVAGLLGALPVALAMAGFGGYFLARRALAPIEGMARRAREINADQLHARLEAPDPNDELGHMAAAFNDTLARLERSFEQLRRFTSDAAHELRTPLTAIRSVGEVGLRTEAGAEHYREVIASMLEEVSRLTRLVDGLLAVARADAGQVQLERTGVAVLELARDVAAFLEALAEEKGLILSVEGDDSVLVSGDRLVLRQVLVNLLDNAIKYSPAGGRVAVRVLCDGEGQAAIEVEDSGPGIAAEHRERVFDRFYRVDEARSREAGGVGLGLAMAKWGAEAHGGRLDLVSGDSGCRFRLRLPAARREPASS